MAASDNGFLLLDAGLNLIASNAPALQILCFPSGPDRIKQPKVFLADRVRTSLLDHRNQDSPNFVSEFRSGSVVIFARAFNWTVTDNIRFSPLSLFCWSAMP